MLVLTMARMILAATSTLRKFSADSKTQPYMLYYKLQVADSRVIHTSYFYILYVVMVCKRQ